MSLSGIILGLINIGIVIAVLVLVGAVVVWAMGPVAVSASGSGAAHVSRHRGADRALYAGGADLRHSNGPRH